MRLTISIIVLLLGLGTTRPASAQDAEFRALADSLAAQVKAKGKGPVAITAFTNCDFGPAFSSYLVSRLNVLLARGSGGLDVVARERTEDAFREMNLGLSKYYDIATFAKIGKQVGARAVIRGTFSIQAANAQVSIIAEIIDVESGRIIGGEVLEIRYTDDIKSLLVPTGGCGGGLPASMGVVPEMSGGRSGNALSTKDLGALRVTLRSVAPSRVRGQNGAMSDGLRVTLEFINRETKKPISTALNVMPSGTEFGGARLVSLGLAMGTVLRTTLMDEQGTVWKSTISDVIGLGTVSVGRKDADQVASPADITTLLKAQDDLGTNERTDRPRGDNRPDPTGAQLRSGYYPPYKFVFGSLTPLTPGESLVVAIDFAPDGGRTSSAGMPRLLNLVGEIVVGVAEANSKSTYSLRTLTFERITPSLIKP